MLVSGLYYEMVALKTNYEQMKIMDEEKFRKAVWNC
jgi:hypothetical protein